MKTTVLSTGIRLDTLNSPIDSYLLSSYYRFFFSEKDFFFFFDLDNTSLREEFVESTPASDLYQVCFAPQSHLNISEELDLVLTHYFPYLLERYRSAYICHRLEQSGFSKNMPSLTKENEHILKELFHYEGDIRTGLVFFSYINNSSVCVLEYKGGGVKSMLNKLYRHFREEIRRALPPDPMEYLSCSKWQMETDPKTGKLVKKLEFEEDSPLSMECQARLDVIASELMALKESGELYLALPILKELMQDNLLLDKKELSPLVVDQDYSLRFPLYGGMELKLSHLTKVVYLLFYRHIGGIRLSELAHYREELRELYLEISNQNNLDKMEESIDNLIDLSTKAIYTHFSRIKSALYELMYEKIAERYCIVSDQKDKDLRYIPWCKMQIEEERYIYK